MESMEHALMMMMKMNIRTILVPLIICIVVYLILSILLPIDITSVRQQDVAIYNSKISILEEKLEEQIKETKYLLDHVKEQLRKVAKQEKKVHEETTDVLPVIPVLVISCNRVTVRRCLDSLIKQRPNIKMFPIIVSQDCTHNATTEAIMEYVTPTSGVTLIKQPDDPIAVPKKDEKFRGYYKISRHFRRALNHIFGTLKYETVIIVEDDLDIAPDFFEYFMGTYPLLKKDPSLWCISAWNDNGKSNLIESSGSRLLYRTDFFPGLGWMLRADTWSRLEPRWPLGFFDDWLRNPVNTANKSCIRPEISRTITFGKIGVSKGLFFDKHLKFIKLNSVFVPFTEMDLSYLIKDNYDRQLESMIESLPEVDVNSVTSRSDVTGPVKIYYNTQTEFKMAAKKLGLMDDFRSGVPRTAYRGIVTCFTRNIRMYLVPGFKWTHYDPTWS